jgi:hypothetical protein
VPYAGAGTGGAEVVAAIGIAVVGHDPLDLDAVAGKPGARPLEEGNRAGLALVGEDLGSGQARGVIDRDVQVFPADAAVAVDHAGPAAGDAVADAGDPAELLGVDVDQLVRRALLARWDAHAWRRTCPIGAAPTLISPRLPRRAGSSLGVTDQSRRPRLTGIHGTPSRAPDAVIQLTTARSALSYSSGAWFH